MPTDEDKPLFPTSIYAITKRDHEEPSSAEKVAKRLNASPRGTERLLNALVAMKLLIKTDDKYANSSSAGEFLSKNSPKYIGNIIMHHHHLVESWSQLDQAVQSGRPVRKRSSFDDEKRRESFLMGMFNMAMHIAPMLIPGIDISSRRHLLDLGGGPGTYAIHFCRHNPRLKATVFDMPTTRPVAEKTIARFELSERINFVGGNYLQDDIEGRFDAAWLSHILHGESPEGCNGRSPFSGSFFPQYAAGNRWPGVLRTAANGHAGRCRCKGNPAPCSPDPQ